MKTDLEKFIETYEFAKKAHAKQKRITGEPYITHPVAVANIALNHGADDATINACLLHDVVEDTQITLEEIKNKFGEDIAFLVDGVTKAETPEATFEKIKRYAEQNKRVMLIKLADRVHNTSTFNETEFGDTKKKYRVSNRGYIDLGRKHGYLDLAEQLNNLTDKL